MNNVMPVLAPFRLVFSVHDIAMACTLCGDILDCPKGHSSPDWVDSNFYGYQVAAHLAPGETSRRKTSAVNDDNVPVRHFSMVPPVPEWETAADRLRVTGIEFTIEPHIRFKGEVDEQATMFFFDPLGGTMGIKAFANTVSLSTK